MTKCFSFLCDIWRAEYGDEGKAQCKECRSKWCARKSKAENKNICGNRRKILGKWTHFSLTRSLSACPEALIQWYNIYKDICCTKQILWRRYKTSYGGERKRESSEFLEVRLEMETYFEFIFRKSISKFWQFQKSISKISKFNFEN